MVVGPPGSRRVRAFQATLAGLGRPPARVVPYLDLLGGADLAGLVRPGDTVRFESPGEDAATERALLALGGVDATDLDLEGGELAPTGAWFRGFSALLRRLGADLDRAPPHRRMNDPEDILAMFDKPETHARLSAAGVPVPEALPPASDADALLDALRTRGWRRVFVKLAHGSGAAGAVALELAGERALAVTTARLVADGEGGTRVFNSRRLERVEGLPAVRDLLAALAPHGLHAERWVPKAALAGRPFDLRVVVIAGRARHVLVRLGRGPMTNLHLGNDRGDPEELRARLGEAGWANVLRVAEAALAPFPRSLYGGVDVLVPPNLRRAFVLEVNAFGDYHRGVLSEGEDTYAAELRALEARA